MGLARFYADRVSPGDVQLDEAESNHASKVLRSQVGEDVLLFDGLGNEGFGTIQSIARRHVTVGVASTRFAPRDHDGRLAVAVAMPKGDRQRHVIEKLVELGVDHLIPIETERSVARMDTDASARLTRTMVEACKQSGRNRFLQIHGPLGWQDFLRNPSWSTHRRWVLHPRTDACQAHQLIRDPITASEESSSKSFLFAVGPEGGFTDREIETATTHRFSILDLGERILRVETAVAFAAVLGHLMTTMHRDDNPAHR
jgi:16S rRNA (uracil1498-N3)-methyltransferase